MANPVTARALDTMHRDLAHRWTASGLARLCTFSWSLRHPLPANRAAACHSRYIRLAKQHEMIPQLGDHLRGRARL